MVPRSRSTINSFFLQMAIKFSSHLQNILVSFMDAFRRQNECIYEYSAFYFTTARYFFDNFLWCCFIDAIGCKWKSPPLIPLTHHVHKRDGHAVAASKLHHVFDGLGELIRVGIPRQVLPTPAWRKNIDALGTKCPWAAIKNCALATRGWNLHRPVWLRANRGIQVSAATLWPLLRRRTPAAEHCGTYKKLKQDTQFCRLDLDVQTFLAPVVR